MSFYALNIGSFVTLNDVEDDTLDGKANHIASYKLIFFIILRIWLKKSSAINQIFDKILLFFIPES